MFFIFQWESFKPLNLQNYVINPMSPQIFQKKFVCQENFHHANKSMLNSKNENYLSAHPMIPAHQLILTSCDK